MVIRHSSSAMSSSAVRCAAEWSSATASFCAFRWRNTRWTRSRNRSATKATSSPAPPMATSTWSPRTPPRVDRARRRPGHGAGRRCGPRVTSRSDVGTTACSTSGIDPGEPWFLEAGPYCSYAPASVIAVMAAPPDRVHRAVRGRAAGTGNGPGAMLTSARDHRWARVDGLAWTGSPPKRRTGSGSVGRTRRPDHPRRRKGGTTTRSWHFLRSFGGRRSCRGDAGAGLRRPERRDQRRTHAPATVGVDVDTSYVRPPRGVYRSACRWRFRTAVARRCHDDTPPTRRCPAVACRARGTIVRPTW